MLVLGRRAECGFAMQTRPAGFAHMRRGTVYRDVRWITVLWLPAEIQSQL